METISIPSPSAFLNSPMLRPSMPPAPLNAVPKRPSAAERTSSDETIKGDMSTKPKQSKSRNGCITCKAKRLKCDETKPACQQCHKRSVTCGGYKKDFKWRAFEETSFTNKTIPSKRKSSPPSVSSAKPSKQSNTSLESPPLRDNMSEASFSSTTPAPTPLRDSFFGHLHKSSQSSPLQSDISTFEQGTPTSYPLFPVGPSTLVPQSDPSQSVPQSPPVNFEGTSEGTSLSRVFHDGGTMRSSTNSPSNMSGQSPRLIDLLLPGTDLNNPPHYLDYQSKQSEPLYQPMAQSTPRVDILESEDEEVEEIDRQPELDPEAWIMRLPSPSLSNSSSSSTTSSQDPVNVLYRQVDFPAASPEMLMLRFDKQTCGILSVKDGPTENPWRTLIWPLARESPALYHAIASMTAFHTSKEKPSLRVEGMDHMRQSIHALASSINNMATETALATTLVLAFSESWDVHISTGIEHLRGAKILVNQALVQHRSTFNSRESVARLKFLVNTWVYMDVIARLTSVDNDESNDFDHAVASDGPFGEIAEVDPLMGCATSLFPLIGRVANLVRRVRRSETNSPAIISQATDLKAQIESWEVGSNFDPPEDPTSEIKHSMQTAEAYRWATLLYLHQAVPEIPSPSAAILAKNVLKYLATVPLSSRTVIIHIYPLLAAGCEVVGQEDREWVRDRWAAMISRMWIGNIDRCWEVVKEVWGRRDQFAREQAVPARPYGHSGGLSRESSVDMSYANGSTERDFHAEDQANDDSYGWAEMSSEIAGGGERRAPGSNACLSRPTQGNMHHRKSSAENITEDLDLEMTVRGRLHWVGVMKDWNWEILLG